MNSPLRFSAPYGVQIHDLLEERTLCLLRKGRLIASFSVEEWGGDDKAYEAAWHYLYGPSDDLIAQSIVSGVAELPDRTSPESQPEMMLVTGEELTAIVLSNLKTS